MWTATLKEKRFEAASLQLVITYDDGAGRSFDERVSIPSSQSSDWLGSVVYQRIQQLTDLDTFGASLQLGSVAPAAPAPVDTSGMALQVQAARLKSLIGLQNLGVAVDATEVANLQSSLSTAVTALPAGASTVSIVN